MLGASEDELLSSGTAGTTGSVGGPTFSLSSLCDFFNFLVFTFAGESGAVSELHLK